MKRNEEGEADNRRNNQEHANSGQPKRNQNKAITNPNNSQQIQTRKMQLNHTDKNYLISLSMVNITHLTTAILTIYIELRIMVVRALKMDMYQCTNVSSKLDYQASKQEKIDLGQHQSGHSSQQEEND